jgi:VanZ family protein
MVLIFVLSSIPGTSLPQVEIWNADKAAHAFVFCVFFWLLQKSLGSQTRNAYLRRNRLFFAFLIVVGYAALDEIHQGYVPGRSKDVFDFIADVFGGGVCALILMLVQLFRWDMRSRTSKDDSL